MNPLVSTCDRLLRVRGTVQGVGFRPFVLRLATELGVRGWVRNDAEGVLVRAMGDEVQLGRLAEQIVSRAPVAAQVTGVEWIEDEREMTALVADGFSIGESAAAGSEIATSIPPDLAPCSECRREMDDPANRRQGYPFINCTQCGPRYSIIESLPYDRPGTTMRRFRMCVACDQEYRDPLDRRFHAEPNACPECGPQLRLFDSRGQTLAEGDRALVAVVAALDAGQVVAVKGAGGFHLMTDATRETSVAELRRRKHREQKPLAVMFRDLAMLRAWTEPTAVEEALLQSPRAPIVLVRRRTSPTLATSVAPGNPWIGALLPSAPVHLQLLGAVNRPLIATSANLSDEPLCIEDREAQTRLEGIADLFLGNDREIARPVDDSVVRFTRDGAAIVLRRARGYAPTPLRLPSSLPRPLVCVGGQMKNAVAVASGDRVVLSPHIGDLGGVVTLRAFRRTIDLLSGLLGAQVSGFVGDKHPDYASTRFVEGSGLPWIPVQHHLAHVLAVLLEHRQPADGVLGVAWDGTGYGEDGTIWGGEFISLQGGRARRFARLRPFRLLGGEAAVRDARRVAWVLADAVDADAGLRVAAGLGFGEADTSILRGMLVRGLNSPVCSSVGRLFDGIGALLGLGRFNSFEGQTPLAVEIAAMQVDESEEILPFAVIPAPEGAVWEIDWRPAVEVILGDSTRRPAAIAAALHRGLARALVEVALLSGASTVVLSGGCFQNALLRSLAETGLAKAGLRVLAARDLPPNDGAIAAGQALGALWNLTTVELPSPRSA